jgi:hypothetical protein
MVWRDGNPVMFLDDRTLFADAQSDGTATRFQMTEVFTGVLLPLIAGKLPDFAPIFERYAADLKVESEK